MAYNRTVATKYETDIVPRFSDIKEWAMKGDTVRDICKKLNISPDTWYRYCKEHETLSELINVSRSVLNNEVEKSLLKLCTGYEYEEVKTIIEETANGKKKTRIEKTKKHQPASPQAVSFWLRNRAPDEWSERKEIIFDTKSQEEERKKLFLQMVNDEIVDADYSVAEDGIPETEIIEETDEGFIDEFENDDYNEDDPKEG